MYLRTAVTRRYDVTITSQRPYGHPHGGGSPYGPHGIPYGYTKSESASETLSRRTQVRTAATDFCTAVSRRYDVTLTSQRPYGPPHGGGSPYGPHRVP